MSRTGVGIETLQGEGRFFGGVSRVEVLKQYWEPLTDSNCGATIGRHYGALINSAGDYGQIEMRIPSDKTLRYVWLVGIGVINQANMNLEIRYDFGTTGEAYNVHTGLQVEAVTTVANQIFMQPLALAAVPEADDILGLVAIYNAGAPATNLYVLGAWVQWQ